MDVVVLDTMSDSTDKHTSNIHLDRAIVFLPICLVLHNIGHFTDLFLGRNMKTKYQKPGPSPRRWKLQLLLPRITCVR